MADLIRDAPLGQVLRLLTGNKVLLYADERADWRPPLQPTNSSESGASTVVEAPVSDKLTEKPAAPHRSSSDPKAAGDIKLVVFEPNDPDNPQNWSTLKKSFVVGNLCWLTMVVYMGASVISPGVPLLMRDWSKSEMTGTLVISIYVLGYALGPMVFSPLSEIPSLGRSIWYIVPLTMYFMLSFGAAWAPSWYSLVGFRFLTGLTSSPALATGAATLIDVLGEFAVGYGLAFWVLAAYMGPGLGPVLSAYQTIVSNDWRWTMWTQLIFTFTCVVGVFIALPETNPDKILRDRAIRLRKRTGDQTLRSQGELEQAKLSPAAVLIEAFYRPVQICVLDPSVLYLNVLVALLYALYYLSFASFPIIFFEEYMMPLDNGNLPYLSIAVGGTIFFFFYVALLRFVVWPKLQRDGPSEPEEVLVPGMIGVWIIAIGLWIYTWTSRPSVHWIVPCIGIALFAGGMFWVFQSAFSYLAKAYPRYSASLFAANELCRGGLAFLLLLAGVPLFRNLGIAGGNSLCAGLVTLFAPGFFILYRYGARLRARSRFADTTAVEKPAGDGQA